MLDNNLFILSVFTVTFCILINYFFNNKYTIALSVIIFLEGLSAIFLSNKLPWYFGFLLIVISSYYLYPVLISNNKQFLNKNIAPIVRLSLTTFRRYFLFLGIIILFLDIYFNYRFFDPQFGGLDNLIIFFSLNLIFYNIIPEKFEYERDFTFLFSFIILLIFVIPTVIFSSFSDLSSTNPHESYLVRFLLSIPLEKSLNFLGYESIALNNNLHYYDSGGNLAMVSVARGCSGLYSVVIFVSAFFSYSLINYPKFDFNLTLFLIIGLIISYFANLFRMMMIVIVGIYYGHEALLVAHSNFGWIIFSCWMLLFWEFLLRFNPNNS